VGKIKKITNTLAQSINSWHPEWGDDSGGFSSWFDHKFLLPSDWFTHGILMRDSGKRQASFLRVLKKTLKVLKAAKFPSKIGKSMRLSGQIAL
jgi:hypothetical protein